MKDNGQIAIGLIGLGAVSEHYYAPALRTLMDENLVSVEALFDPNSNRVAKFHDLFPLAVTIDNLSQLQERKIDLAIVASPAAFHAGQAAEALKFGCNVLCEKPMATSVADCQLMIEAANKSGLMLSVGHVRRHFPALQAIKDILVLGVLGAVREFEFTEGGPFQWPAASKSFFAKAQAGGGVFLDTGVHVVDLLLWFFGSPSEFKYQDDSMGGLEANCRLDVKFGAGTVGRIQLSRDWWLPNQYKIKCEKGNLLWKVAETSALQVDIADDVQLSDAVAGILARHNCLSTAKNNHSDAFANQLRSVISRVAGFSDGQIVSGAEALLSLQFIDDCYKERQLMTMDWLTKPEQETAIKLSKVGSP